MTMSAAHQVNDPRARFAEIGGGNINFDKRGFHRGAAFPSAPIQRRCK